MLGKLKYIWEDNKKYFYVACILMLAGGFIGFVQADKVEKIAVQMLAQLKDLVEKIGSNNDALSVFWLIFSNNVTSAVLMMVFGIALAIPPIFGMVTNGILLGYLFQEMAESGHNIVLMFIVGILPHGIFELPAVIFAAGVGIRYGLLMIRGPLAIWTEKGRNELKSDWIHALKQFPYIVVSVILMLLVAAIVESVITPAIIENTIGNQIKLIPNK